MDADTGSSRKRPRELLSGLSKEAQLSSELRLLKIRLSERELQHSLELERVQLALQEEGNLRESLERKVNFLSSEERRLRGDLRAKASEIVELKSGFNAQLQSAKQQGEELQEENAQLLHKVSGLEVELQRVRRRTSDKQQEGDPSELRNLREQNTLLEAQLLSLQGGAADAIAKAPEQRQGEDEDLPVEDLQAMRMARMRIAELERLVRKLRREIDAYKEQSRSQLVAEEEIRSLKDSLSREKKHREASLQRVAAAETERSAATTALEEAKAVEKKNREAFLSRVADAEREQSAAAVALEEAKATVQRLLAEKEGLEHRGRALEETIREREKQISFFSTQAAQRETAMDAILDRLHTKGESNLAEDRVQQLRGELENSEAERARLGERLAMLEGSLQEALKRKDAADLARNLEVQQLREGLSMARIDLKTAEEQLCALRARAPAQSDAAQGRDRILHAKDNPYVEALKEKVAAQKKEIANLSKELKALADSSQGSSGSGESVNAAKLRQRLKTMFAERVKVLREAVYLLTGWKVDMATDRENPQLRLRSMYAEKEDDSLLFAWKSPKDSAEAAPEAAGAKAGTEDERELQLLETPFALGADSRSFIYLEKYHSVPAFLAHITLDLAEKQTIMPW